MIKTRESKLEILREIVEKKSGELNTKKKIKRKEMKKLIIEEINQEAQ